MSDLQAARAEEVHENQINGGCRCHGSGFGLADGAVVNLEANEPIEVYRIRIEGGNVVVTVE